MARYSEFVLFLLESLEQLGTVTARAMFGGYGLYLEGRMFGLVAEDELYLKTDREIDCYFDQLSLPHFEYEKKGRRFKMSYRRCPDEALDDAEILAQWVTRSYQAALRARS